MYSWVCNSEVGLVREKSPRVMIMSQVIALNFIFFSFLFCPFPALLHNIWPRSSNMSSPSEEEEQAIRPINKRQVQTKGSQTACFVIALGSQQGRGLKWSTAPRTTEMVSSKCQCSLYTKQRERNTHAAIRKYNLKWFMFHLHDSTSSCWVDPFIIYTWAINYVLYYCGNHISKGQSSPSIIHREALFPIYNLCCSIKLDQTN